MIRKMTRRGFPAGMGVAVLGLLTPGCLHVSTEGRPESRSRPPNIVFILADDLGWAEFGCCGNTFNETPHLDRLPHNGMRFTAAYAAAPVRSPLRAALMTGRYPACPGITDYLRPNDLKHLPRHNVTLPEMLRAAGYVNHGAEESPPGEHGSNKVIVSENRGIANGSYFFPCHFNTEIVQRLPGNEHLVDRCNLETVEFTGRHRDEPVQATGDSA